MSFSGAQAQGLPPSGQYAEYGHSPAPTAHPDHQFTLPKGFIAVIVVAIVYAIGRGTGLSLQFAYLTGDLFGENTTISENAAEAIWWAVCALPIVAAIPALVLLAGKGTRPPGAAFARWCVLLIVISSLAFIVAFALPSRYEQGSTTLVSQWGDFLVATAAAAAWIATHRGSRYSLVAAPVAGGLAIVVGQVWSNILADNLFSTAAKGTAVQDSFSEGQRIDYGAVWFGTAMASIFTVLTLVAAAWLAYGIERLLKVMKVSVPDAPVSMWHTLTAGRYQGLHLALAAFAVSAAIPAPLVFWASGAGPEDAKILYQVLLALIVVVAGMILIAAALECVVDRKRRLWVTAASVLAVALAVTRIFVASNLVTWFGMLALALAFIVALVPDGKAPLAGIVAAFLVFAAPAGKANLEQNTVTVYADSTARLTIWALILIAAVVLGYLIGWVVSYAENYQGKAAAAAQAPVGYPDPAAAAFGTQPQYAQGYAPQSNPQGYPVASNPQGYVAPTSPQGYPVPSNPQGYAAPTSPQGYASPSNPQGYAQPRHGQGHPVPPAEPRYHAGAAQPPAQPAYQQAPQAHGERPAAHAAPEPDSATALIQTGQRPATHAAPEPDSVTSLIQTGQRPPEPK